MAQPTRQGIAAELVEAVLGSYCIEADCCPAFLDAIVQAQLVLAKHDLPQHDKCEGCGNEIDATVCHCGVVEEDHSDVMDHAFCPMGCTCGYARDWIEGKDDPDANRASMSSETLVNASTCKTCKEVYSATSWHFGECRDCYTDRQNENAPCPSHRPCGGLSINAHECPYQADVNNDRSYRCTCCASCMHECAADI